jgi:dienelactone hydrolase
MNIKHFVSLAILLMISQVSAQTFDIGHTTISFSDSSRNRTIPTEIYYPSDNPGEDVPLATGTFPILIFGHGFVMSWEAYENFWTELVPRGYVICFPNTETGIAPNHADLGMDMRWLAAQMQAEGRDSTSLFFQKIAPKTAVMGHSMGGGASFLAAENNPDISTLVNFAAAETNPSAIAAASNITVPALIFSGDDDCVTPPAQHQDIMYDSLASDCKTQISIIKGGHCYFANNNFLCTFGESSCNPTLDITREAQQAVMFDFLNPWLKYTLYDEQQAFTTFQDSLQQTARVHFSQICPTTDISDLIENEAVRMFPNPAFDQLNWVLTKENTGGLLVIYNLMGAKVYQDEINKIHTKIDISFLPTGTYVMAYFKGSITYSSRFIKGVSK